MQYEESIVPESEPVVRPKVFISYSWSSLGHQETVRSWADRLLSDGVEVVIDIYDLQEGHDKFHFMEGMVTDPEVTHVLVVSDQTYAEKADQKKAGVGTESQIISNEVYGKVTQSKFIPIVAGFDEKGEPHLPVFLKSRIWINFSSPEAVNQNWERLLRLLHGKPSFVKPQVGNIPTYLSAEAIIQANPAAGKLAALKQALISDSRTLKLQRQDFLSAVLEFADSMRIRKDPGLSPENLAAKILEDCARLKDARNLIVDWVMMESGGATTEEFREELLNLFEKLLDLKSRPTEINGWNDVWFQAEALFVYETFLYIVAALLKTESFQVLHEVLTSRYIKPETERYTEEIFTDVRAFNAFADVLQLVLAESGRRYLSPAAELLKRQADRSDLPFAAIIEADLLVFLMALISPDGRWIPQTLFYRSDRGFPFFVRATQHRNFSKLAIITAEPDANKLREAAKAGYERLGVNQWSDFAIHVDSPLHCMNLDKLDTLA
jgi:hypothetical protein